MLSWWCLLLYVVVVTRVPHQMRRSRFLLRLCEVGFALQPKGGEHIYPSSRYSIDPREPASNRGMAPAVIFRVVRYGAGVAVYITQNCGRGAISPISIPVFFRWESIEAAYRQLGGRVNEVIPSDIGICPDFI